MQAGLERTSGGNYGAWISSRNWVRDALRRPFVTDPGGSMLYSTGSTHLLSAILTKASGKSTLALAREWLGPAGVRVTDWERDPQGIYLGGNQMAMTPRSLLAFGELYRRGGSAPTARASSPKTGSPSPGRRAPPRASTTGATATAGSSTPSPATRGAMAGAMAGR